MSLRDVMAFIQQHHAAGAAATPATPPKPVGLQPKPAWIGACTPATPATPHFYEVGVAAPIERTEAAASDHDASPAPAPPASDVTNWHTLDKAYQAHHFKCAICIAAGKGYGQHCGAGAALRVAYDTCLTHDRTAVAPTQERPQ